MLLVEYNILVVPQLKYLIIGVRSEMFEIAFAITKIFASSNYDENKPKKAKDSS